MSSPFCKNISVFPKPKSPLHKTYPVPHRGALAIVINVGAGCGGRGGDARRAAHPRTAKSCGPDAPVLASSLAGHVSGKATVARKPFTEESTKETVKPLRREGRSVPAEPVCSCASSLPEFAHETAGAARTRSSLRPHCFEGQCFSLSTRAFRAARSRTSVLSTV